jgi:imidazolonepropionase-like amidohydrolase
MRSACCLVLMLIGVASSHAAEPKIALTNARIYTLTENDPIRGTLIIQNKTIVGITPAGEKFEADKTIDLDGAVIIPGLVDTHSHIGIYPKPSVAAHQDGNEMSGPVQPGIRAIDAIWPNDPGIRMALAGGVTTVNIMPGSGNVIGGQTLYVKLRGNTVEQMRIFGKGKDGVEILGGLKMANGENPKGYGRNKQQAPFTRMKVASLQREQFVKAKEYMEKMKGEKKPDRDVNLEPLVEVLQGKRTVHFHCHRADDLMTAVRISEEFGFELVLQHATEGYRVADILAAKKIPVSLTLVDSPGGKAETIGLLEENASILEKAGVPVTINTDDFITESRFFLRTAALAIRGGMSETAALKAITITPAKVLHLDHRIGSLAAGKDADFVVLSGPPYSVYTKVMQTWIEGEKVFDAVKESDRPYRDGGFALPLGTKLPEVGDIRDLQEPKRKLLELENDKDNIYIQAGRLHLGNGEAIMKGVVVINKGKIIAVDAAEKIKIPANAKVFSAAEVTPGLIDPFTVAGLSGAWNIPADQDQDEPSDPNQADLRVIDGFNPHEPLLEYLRMHGITTVHTTPGRVNVIAGTSGIFRSGGQTIEKIGLNKAFSVIVNLGETPKEAFKAKGPATRMATAALVRKAFTEAQSYRTKKEPGPKNAKHEALIPALEGKMPVIFAAHRADDIRTALRISEEFNLKPMIALGTESFLLVDELAAKKVPVIVHPALQRPGGSMETLNTMLNTAAVLKSKGVPITLGTAFEGYVPKQRNLRAEAAGAAANGLTSRGAIRAITLDAARLLGIDENYGTIEAGKVADIVLYDGDPLETRSHVTHTFMNGKLVYLREEYLKLPFERRMLPLLGGGAGVGCCLGW